MQSHKTNSCLRSSLLELRKVAVVSAIVLLVLTFLAAAPPIPNADPHRYLDDIKALTVPAMEGRGDGTKV